WDCTLIDDDQDASDIGLLQATRMHEGNSQKGVVADKKPEASGPSQTAIARKKQTAPAHRPGIWVVYFSLGALPLFGLGQTLLPGDSSSRRIGLVYLLVYLAAALGLLLTTGFLGLRRYLRQRFLRMPGNVAFGWIKFGVGVTAVVLGLALLLPRPGAYYVWKSLGYRIDYTLRKASEYASRANPPGTGSGRPGNHGNQTGEQNGQGGKAQSNAERNQGANVGQRNSAEQCQAKTGQGQSAQSSPVTVSPAPVPRFYNLFRTLFFLTVALILGWWAFRQRHLFWQILRSLFAVIAKFFQTLFGLGPGLRLAKRAEKKPKKMKPVIYQNPFLTGADKVWPPERLVLYSFEAIQAWAMSQGAARKPEQTAREFCLDLSDKYPEVAAGLDQLSFLYGHAAYGIRLPDSCDMESLRPLWRYVTESQSLSFETAEAPAQTDV
ncbi:MAG TPA: DUF4129 domain-containing protein, partial [Verrucomicrobiae bacterium]|nr:DUF4129 domain-containing protein [Verrucomicrobiae bacterium]